MNEHAEQTLQPTGRQLIKRRIGAAAVAVTVVAGIGVYADGLRVIHNHHQQYTNKMLENAGMQPETLAPGEGIEQAVLDADPDLANDGQGLAAVTNFVKHEGIPIEVGNTLEIPITK